MKLKVLHSDRYPLTSTASLQTWSHLCLLPLGIGYIFHIQEQQSTDNKNV